MPVLGADVNAATLEEIQQLQVVFDGLDKKLNGYTTKNEIGEKNQPTVNSRLFSLDIGISRSTYGPTSTHKDLVKWIEGDLRSFGDVLENLYDDIQAIGKKIEENGGPQIEGID